MLNQQAFVKELQALADRFNRTISDELARRYYTDLQHLETEDFLKAAHTIYKHDTFWPAPARFLEAVGMDPKSQAELAWEQTLDDARNGKAQPYSMYGPAHAHALRKIGGLTALGRVNEDRLPFIRREFVSIFKAHMERGNLPQLEDKPEVPRLPDSIMAKLGRA